LPKHLQLAQVATYQELEPIQKQIGKFEGTAAKYSHTQQHYFKIMWALHGKLHFAIAHQPNAIQLTQHRWLAIAQHQ
jgi:hypothetical protein